MWLPPAKLKPRGTKHLAVVAVMTASPLFAVGPHLL